jgi:hypothetical protein
MKESNRQKISQVVNDINLIHARIEFQVARLKEHLDKFKDEEMENQTSEFWKTRALCDSLIRIRIFIEKNLTYIETLSVLSLCRYTLELVVWLKNIEADQRFSLVYARRLFVDQIQFYEDLANQLVHEMDLYKSLAEEEESLHKHVIENAIALKATDDGAALGRRVAESMQNASDSIDQKLKLNLVLYSDDAKYNGYKLQAHILETQVLPQAIKNMNENKASLVKFDSNWDKTISELNLNLGNQNNSYLKWVWKGRAEYVGMHSDFDLIYSYTSRLLHATPVSLTTNQKSLEDDEVLMFLRYVGNQFRWIIEYAEKQSVSQKLH